MAGSAVAVKRSSAALIAIWPTARSPALADSGAAGEGEMSGVACAVTVANGPEGTPGPVASARN
jgi:hypothetical protein